MELTFTPALTQVTATQSRRRNNITAFLRLHALFLRRRLFSLKFLLAAQLCLPRGLSPSLPFPFSPLRHSCLPAVCLPASGSDLSISHKLSVPSLECPLTLIRLELPAAFPFAQSQFQFLLLLGGSWGPARSQSEPKWETRKQTCVCVCVRARMRACLCVCLLFSLKHAGYLNSPFSQSWFSIHQSNFIFIYLFLSPRLNHPIAY